MAWDTERTKSLLLAAAVSEFSAHGPAGARVDRIAATAGINKERTYQYFGNKTALFDAVLLEAVRRAIDTTPIQGTGPKAVADYAGRLYDHHQRDNTLSRLSFWEGLERGSDLVGFPQRAVHFSEKIDIIVEALPNITRENAIDLLITIITLCRTATVLPGLQALTTESNPARPSNRRAAVVKTAELLASAMTS
ncbi:TetR/AcrR family transcriptional regulator [Paenarthrobacter sp. NPDC089714]|uniref:TetR/AcrR family transcriptional regulator n=1 Tax=Paenarthrobacter sp. NPDC089714 TaxID=3364377 RepID=UPI0038001425